MQPPFRQDTDNSSTEQLAVTADIPSPSIAPRRNQSQKLQYERSRLGRHASQRSVRSRKESTRQQPRPIAPSEKKDLLSARTALVAQKWTFLAVLFGTNIVLMLMTGYFFQGHKGLSYFLAIFKLRDMILILIAIVSSIWLAITGALRFIFCTPPQPPPSARNVISVVPCYSETQEQVIRTLDSIINNDWDNHRNAFCLITDGGPTKDLHELFDTVDDCFSSDYVTWRGDSNTLVVHVGTIGGGIPCVTLSKQKNAGKKDSLVVSHELFNVRRPGDIAGLSGLRAKIEDFLANEFARRDELLNNEIHSSNSSFSTAGKGSPIMNTAKAIPESQLSNSQNVLEDQFEQDGFRFRDSVGSSAFPTRNSGFSSVQISNPAPPLTAHSSNRNSLMNNGLTPPLMGHSKARKSLINPPSTANSNSRTSLMSINFSPPSAARLNNRNSMLPETLPSRNGKKALSVSYTGGSWDEYKRSLMMTESSQQDHSSPTFDPATRAPLNRVYFSDSTSSESLAKPWAPVSILKNHAVVPESEFNIDYLFHTDADSIIEPGSILALINRLERMPNAVGACGLVLIDFIEQAYGIWNIFQAYQYAFGQIVRRQGESRLKRVICLPGCITLLRCTMQTMEAVVQYGTPPPPRNLFLSQVQLLGTDRRLTSLLLQQGSSVQTVMEPKAVCKTIPPQNYRSYIRQRQRWGSNAMFNGAANLISRHPQPLIRILGAADVFRMCLVYLRIFAFILFVIDLVSWDKKKWSNWNYVLQTLLPVAVTAFGPTIYFFLALPFYSRVRGSFWKLLLGFVVNKLMTYGLSIAVITTVVLNLGNFAWGRQPKKEDLVEEKDDQAFHEESEKDANV